MNVIALLSAAFGLVCVWIITKCRMWTVNSYSALKSKHISRFLPKLLIEGTICNIN